MILFSWTSNASIYGHMDPVNIFLQSILFKTLRLAKSKTPIVQSFDPVKIISLTITIEFSDLLCIYFMLLEHEFPDQTCNDPSAAPT